ncbi:MAG TPA: DUF559 domain-containing protein [Chloroflexota bacterium]|nr:DUF559 domain-containing protein [Chloroflexota bacterium]
MSVNSGAEHLPQGKEHEHFHSDKISIDRRRALRRSSTDAERSLWRLLRSRQLSSVKFRRQEPIGPYFLDFYCISQNLAIEIDGGHHFTPEGVAKDAVRTEFLHERGIRVLRVSNRDVLMEPESVVLAISALLRFPSP